MGGCTRSGPNEPRTTARTSRTSSAEGGVTSTVKRPSSSRSTVRTSPSGGKPTVCTRSAAMLGASCRRPGAEARSTNRIVFVPSTIGARPKASATAVVRSMTKDEPYAVHGRRR